MIHLHIKQLRIAKGLSQSDLARQTGTDRTLLSRVENGQRQPTPEFLAALSTVLPLETPPRRGKGQSELSNQKPWVRCAFGPQRIVHVQPLRVAFNLARYSPLGAELVDWLDGQRFSGAVWTAIKLLAGKMNGPEQMLFLHGMRQGGRVQKIHPHETNFRMSVVQAPDEAFLGVLVDGMVIFPQLTVALVTYKPRMDFMLALPGKPPFFIDIEIDGPSHDKERDKARAQKIGLAEIRIPCHLVQRPDFWQYLESKIQDVLARHGQRWAGSARRLKAS